MVDDVTFAILKLCLTQLQEQVGKLTLDESFSPRDWININLAREMNLVCAGFGWNYKSRNSESGAYSGYITGYGATDGLRA